MPRGGLGRLRRVALGPRVAGGVERRGGRIEALLLHPVPQRLAGDTEVRGGPRDVPSLPLERFEDALAPVGTASRQGRDGRGQRDQLATRAPGGPRGWCRPRPGGRPARSRSTVPGHCRATNGRAAASARRARASSAAARSPRTSAPGSARPSSTMSPGRSRSGGSVNVMTARRS